LSAQTAGQTGLNWITQRDFSTSARRVFMGHVSGPDSHDCDVGSFGERLPWRFSHVRDDIADYIWRGIRSNPTYHL
jgi:hypothetical protein